MARQSLAMSASAVSERGEGLGHLDAAVEAVAAENRKKKQNPKT